MLLGFYTSFTEMIISNLFVLFYKQRTLGYEKITQKKGFGHSSNRCDILFIFRRKKNRFGFVKILVLKFDNLSL